ncbi:hypothetical protein MYU51_017953 [Penicillium brevicompactum]|uniref:uncharacterized protein n=1 Tax=Penicillium brevicompactum TaxID=5074 RepID=UPI0025410C0A|nr:uncharacterized protein N7506_010471 [Penicillium brevicompactum]KAJ5327369.1 hypothetical protein N7506_010471 [Penicillium brevicompactum]
MSRARRQALGAFFAVILLLLTYRRYHPTDGQGHITKPTSVPIFTQQQESNQNSIAGPQSQFLWSHMPLRYPVVEIKQVPTESRNLPKVQSIHSETSHSQPSTQQARRLVIKKTFERSWRSYQSLAWAADGIAPVSGTPINGGGWSLKLLETLDTLWIMEMYEDFELAVAAVMQVNFEVTPSPEINTHDTSIRLLGGLLAAYDLSNDGRLLTKCVELGDMLYSAFDTPNRMPIIHWDLHKASRHEEQLAEENILTAELGSFTLEFTRLSQTTGDSKYFDAAQRVMELLDRQQGSTKLPGLWPVFMNPRAELFEGDEFTLGAEGNYLYKILPRAHALTGGHIPIYRRMYERVTFAAAGHNLFQAMNPNSEHFLLPGSVRVIMTQNGKPRTHSLSEVHHRSCFTGGLFAFGGALFNIPAHKRIAHNLVDGCIWAHHSMLHGIMPEVLETVPCASQKHCPWNEWHWKQEAWKKVNGLKLGSDSDFNIDTFIKDHNLPKGFIGIPDATSKLRPDVIESMFVLYRTTGREDLLDKAWDLFQSFNNASKTNHGNAAVIDVTCEGSKPILSDTIENFWMSETLKFFYLIFSSSDLINLDEFVFSAGGHPLRRPSSSG